MPPFPEVVLQVQPAQGCRVPPLSQALPHHPCLMHQVLPWLTLLCLALHCASWHPSTTPRAVAASSGQGFLSTPQHIATHACLCPVEKGALVPCIQGAGRPSRQAPGAPCPAGTSLQQRAPWGEAWMPHVLHSGAVPPGPLLILSQTLPARCNAAGQGPSSQGVSLVCATEAELGLAHAQSRASWGQHWEWAVRGHC